MSGNGACAKDERAQRGRAQPGAMPGTETAAENPAPGEQNAHDDVSRVPKDPKGRRGGSGLAHARFRGAGGQAGGARDEEAAAEAPEAPGTVASRE